MEWKSLDMRNNVEETKDNHSIDIVKPSYTNKYNGENIYEVGDIFQFSNELYIMVRVSSDKEAYLCCLTDGNRWHDKPIPLSVNEKYAKESDVENHIAVISNEDWEYIGKLEVEEWW